MVTERNELNNAADKVEVRRAAGQRPLFSSNPLDWGAPADEGSDKAKVACRAAGGVTCRRGSGRIATAARRAWHCGGLVSAEGEDAQAVLLCSHFPVRHYVSHSGLRSLL